MGLLKQSDKENALRILLDTLKVSREELLLMLLKETDKKFVEAATQIPITIFATNLSPLESITRYLKDHLHKKTGEIAQILGKNHSSISLAYKKAAKKRFVFSETSTFIPLHEFEANKKFSISEIVAYYLRNKGLKFVKIAKLLDKDVRTVWTFYNRAEQKQKRGAAKA
jgi:hypothetical protein